MRIVIGLVVLVLTIMPSHVQAAEPDPLAVGVAGHAFDHLGNIGEQADAAAASGANIIYATSLGALGYQGLPATEQLQQAQVKARAYVDHAKQSGIRLAIGYVC